MSFLGRRVEISHSLLSILSSDPSFFKSETPVVLNKNRDRGDAWSYVLKSHYWIKRPEIKRVYIYFPLLPWIWASNIFLFYCIHFKDLSWVVCSPRVMYHCKQTNKRINKITLYSLSHLTTTVIVTSFVKRFIVRQEPVSTVLDVVSRHHFSSEWVNYPSSQESRPTQLIE